MKHNVLKSLIFISAMVLPCAVLTSSVQAQDLPLKVMDGDAFRDYWLIEQVNKEGTLQALQAKTSQNPVKLSVTQDRAIEIALIYPSADTSDFWARGYLALTKRLNQLGIRYRTTEFASRQIEHSLQSTYTTQVVQDKKRFDYVIFGPSELATQASNIDKLSAQDEFGTFVWAFHTPLKYLENQPDMWLDFSSAYGAIKICEYMVERLGRDISYAMNRGIPGITDDQRSGDFKECVVDKGNWNVVYEHYGEYQREGGYAGTNIILYSYPDATVIHNANTAMAMGSLEALLSAGKEKDIFSTGWGGTGIELDAIRRGEINATPMRMGDDVGAATAEAIKADMEGKNDEMPLVFLGRITVAHDQMSAEELDNLEQEAFRFSGVGALDR